MVAEGRRLGRYTLFRRIGSGAVATVHLGYAQGAHGFRRVVAIKRLHDELAAEPDVRAMLVDEGRLLARIQHRAVVSVLDVVVQGAELWLVTEYVHGESLARLLDACVERRLPPPAALSVAIVIEALHGLAAAHDAESERGEPLGLVHRDVSPQNILVGEQGAVKVADFGVARAIGRLQMTRDGQRKGKLGYMAPEQLRGGEVDARADVFSAAVVLWEALTLRRLFDGSSDLAIADRVTAGAIDRPSRVEPTVPAVLDEIVLRGLARHPGDRWPSARAFAAALEAAVERPRSEAIGSWVCARARAALAERSRLLLEMGELDAPTQVVDRADAVTRVDGTAPAGVPRRAPRRTLAVVAAGATAVALAMVMMPRAPADTPEPWPVPAPSPVAETTRAAPSEEAVAGTSAPDAPAPPPAPPASVTARPRIAAPKQASPREAQPRAACDPPYVIDERGIVRPKRECL
jgi:eukaryotic-like serine/threonine-protein kinase